MNPTQLGAAADEAHTRVVWRISCCMETDAVSCRYEYTIRHGTPSVVVHVVLFTQCIVSSYQDRARIEVFVSSFRNKILSNKTTK